ncbi:MAG: hypothetical protein K2Y56_13920 [Methylobacterium sp.]|uniref:hypothetical protein n=1 Tax=Methylobacterium sp. TaxID=409 RepID=UPI0025F00FB8|nr:hypothetical protein [Methylobacterium sp.]MBX9932615.1 hypothetical protein [Methylobacterium sp.]
MRHALLHDPRRSTMRRALSRHRPRCSSRGRPEQGKARASDVLLAIAGLVLLGALALYAAHLVVERALPM